jgi:hypothetical protein
MEATHSSETLMNLYISTRRYNPSDPNPVTTVRTKDVKVKKGKDIPITGRGGP